MLKQLHINIPFVEAISQMLTYVKFLKKLLSKKEKLEEVSEVTLNEECSTILTKKLPTKQKDLKSLFIPCNIGGHSFNTL